MSPLNHLQQRGAIGLMAAGTLALALLCMLVVLDSGRLYMERRSLQRVADMAALEAAGRHGNCLPATTASAVAFATQSGIRNDFVQGNDGRTMTTLCGNLSVDASGMRTFNTDASKYEAIQVVVTHPVPRSIASGVASYFSSTPIEPIISMKATAVAQPAAPLVQLTLRSAAMTLSSANAAVLNPLIGGLLGGSLNLSVAGWQGLVDTNLNLLSYLTRLSTDLNLKVGDYTQLLTTNISVSQLIQSAISVLDPNNTLAATATISSLNAIKTAAGSTTIALGDLLQVQSGSNLAALNTNMRVFDLVQGLVQVANKKNGLMSAVQLNVPGVAQVTARVQVIQTPQISAIGDPSKIDPSNPTGANRIFVRTAQTRALLSINLPVLGVITPLLNAATNLLTPLTPVINSVLSLNLAATIESVACLVGAGCTMYDFKWLTSGSAGPQIDVSISTSSAQSYVTGYTCTSNTNKTLTTHTDSALLNLKIGQISSAAAFPASTDPNAVVALPLPVLDIGSSVCKKILGIGTCGPRTSFTGGGLGISVNSPIGQVQSTSTNFTYTAPSTPSQLPEVNTDPFFPLTANATLPSSLLAGTIAGVQVHMYSPPTNNVLGSLMSGAESLLGTITSSLDSTINSTLSPLLTGVLDPLLTSLGVTLNPVNLGANMSCNIGQATLVI
jgi:uncharacterized membrane protein